MPQHLQNRSRFATADALLLDREGRELLVVCVAGRFVLPPAGRPTNAPLRVSEEQPPPPRVDEYWGEPGRSSLRREGQLVYVRPGADVHVSGHAWAPRGKPTKEGVVGGRRKNPIHMGRLKGEDPNSNTPASCAAPKLLLYAMAQGWEPLEMVEQWFGPAKGDKEHGQNYKPCQTCRKLLPVLLCEARQRAMDEPME